VTLDAQAQRRLTIFVFLIVPVTTLVVLNIYPILQLFWISLTDFNSINWRRAKFVGIRNFVDLFTFDKDLTLTMANSLFYLAGSIIQLILATWFAVVLNQRLPGSRIFLTILFIPFVLNTVAAGLIFRNFLELNGALNDILQLFLGPDFKVAWLDSSKSYSNFSLAAASVWR
jgi:multiple sugar transport system permease protein